MNNNRFSGQDLTIVICAYKECPYLEKSIRSVLRQTVKANVIISTSTPNEYIRALADKYHLEVHINPDGGHVKDYNFALGLVKTRLGMLSHQDDLLHRDFVKDSLRALNRAKDPIISFTNYIEMHEGRVDPKPSGLVMIKRILVLPMTVPLFRRTVLAKRMGQAFGDPITHPSVICVMNKLPEVVFREEFKASMDWDLWERLSRQKGEFVYVNRVLLYHRMDQNNATAKLLETGNGRSGEELALLSRFWPAPVARFINRYYSRSAMYY